MSRKTPHESTLGLKVGYHFTVCLSYFYTFIICLTNMKKKFYFPYHSSFIAFKHNSLMFIYIYTLIQIFLKIVIII